MSAKLVKALAAGNVTVKKLVSGEVLIKFSNPKIKDITISNHFEVKLTSIKNISIQDIKNSNLKELVAKNILDIILE